MSMTPKFAYEGNHKCDNCQKVWEADQLEDIQDLGQRLDAGGVVPSGECPDCGALCYPHDSKPKRAGKNVKKAT